MWPGKATLTLHTASKQSGRQSGITGSKLMASPSIVDARNLLDAPYEVTQGSVPREHYKSVRSFALGFSWGTDL